MAKRQAATHFVVERFNWRMCGRGTFCRLPGFTRVVSFDSSDDAEQFRHTEEAKARAVVNPFAGTLAPPTDQTNLPEPVLVDWYLDHGFDPPKPAKKSGRRDWTGWWEKESKKWKGDRAALAWEPLHRVKFYRVTERPKVPVGYALVRVNWGYNDEWYYPDAEGGTVTTVYRNRAKADKECAKLNRESVGEWTEIAGEYGYDEAGANQFELSGRVLPGHSPFDPPPVPANSDTAEEFGTFSAQEVPFWEVVEIELEDVA